MIKIINKRNTSGALFHYAHFVIDCLYPEILNEIYKYNTVVRLKLIDQTLGNFTKFYEDVMGNKTTELPEAEFNNIHLEPVVLLPKEQYTDIASLTKFRNYIFNTFSINPDVYLDKYPNVLLIKRGDRVQLIDDPDLQKLNTNITNGKERREIKEIERVENFMKQKYGNKFKAVYLETLPFKEQVKLFHNAKLIVMAHGAATSSVLFCKKKTTIVEIPCGMNFPWFNKCFKIIDINYLKIVNNPQVIINFLKTIII
jgi:hypothetical protein